MDGCQGNTVHFLCTKGNNEPQPLRPQLCIWPHCISNSSSCIDDVHLSLSPAMMALITSKLEVV